MTAGTRRPPRLARQDEYDWHIPGVVDRPDGVGVCRECRGVQSGFPAVGSRPLRLGANEPDSGTARVVVHFPVRGEEGIDIFFRKKVRPP